MSCKDAICRTPVIVTCYIIAVILILIETLLFGNCGWLKSEDDTSTAEEREPNHRSSGEDEPNIPDIPARDAVWQSVDGSSYVYAAYYEQRVRWPNTIRIIGATRTDKRELFRCKFWYSNRTPATGKATVQVFQGHRNKFKFTACFILCPFTTEEIPDSVSVIAHQERLKNHLLVVNTRKHNKTIRHPTKTNKTSRTIGICVKPLHNNYNNSVQLVEFMELNRILGMEHVTFYKSSISLIMECILRNYMDEGRAALATAMPWKINHKSQAEIRNENQLAALNDCLYRNMHNFSYLAFLDLDEFIMPAQNYTMQELIETLESHSHDVPYDIGSYTFQNGFFYLEWPDDFITKKSPDVYARSLTTLLKTTRRDHLHSHGTRSKYIVKPTAVTEVGNHWVSQFLRGYGRLAVFEEEGILNHYRICEYGGSRCTNETSRADWTVFRYKPRLVQAVKHRWLKLQKSCGMEDIQQARLAMAKLTGGTQNTKLMDKMATPRTDNHVPPRAKPSQLPPT